MPAACTGERSLGALERQRLERIVLILAAATALSSCGLVGSITAGDRIDKGMASLVGQPIEAADAKLGPPTEKKVTDGVTVYTWVRLSPSEGKGTSLTCRIHVTMNGDVIGSFDHDGNAGACAYLAAKLQP
jgi:hypothetical protein